MIRDKIDLNYAYSENHFHRVSITQAGAVVLKTSSRYGSSNSAEFLMTAEQARVLGEAIINGAKMAGPVAEVFTDLEERLKTRLDKIRRSGD